MCSASIYIFSLRAVLAMFAETGTALSENPLRTTVTAVPGKTRVKRKLNQFVLFVGSQLWVFSFFERLSINFKTQSFASNRQLVLTPKTQYSFCEWENKHEWWTKIHIPLDLKRLKLFVENPRTAKKTTCLAKLPPPDLGNLCHFL